MTNLEMQELQEKQIGFFNDYLEILEDWKNSGENNFNEDLVQELKDINTKCELIGMGMQYYMMLEKMGRTPADIVVPQPNLKIVQ